MRRIFFWWVRYERLLRRGFCVCNPNSLKMTVKTQEKDERQKERVREKKEEKKERI